MTDKEIIARVLDGDSNVFSELVRKYESKTRSLVRSLVRDPDATEDVIQDTFVKAFEKLSSFRGDSQFSTWLYRLTYNEALQFLRKKGRTRTFSELEKNEQALEISAEQPRGDEELKVLLDKEIAALDEESRFILILREKEGLSYEEIAKTLDISLSALKSRLHRVRLELRDKLKPYLTLERDDDHK